MGHCVRHTVEVRHELCVVVQINVAQFLDDIWNNLPLCGGNERAPSLSEDFHVTFVEWCCVRHTVRVRHNLRRASRSVQKQERRSRRAVKRRSHHGWRVRPQEVAR